MLRIQDKKSTVILYDSLFEAGAMSEFNNDSNRDLHETVMHRYERQGDEAQSWFGAPSQHEFDARLSNGWSEGVDKLRELATKEIQPTSLRRKRIKGDQGDELDIHAIYRGNFSQAWSKTKRMQKLGGSRSVTLVCNLSCAWNVDANELFFRGASVLKLAEALTNSGYNVAIYGADGTDKCSIKENVSITQFVEIKAEDYALDVSSLASLIAMPGYKRTRLHAGVVEECERRGIVSKDALGQANAELLAEAIKVLPISQNAFIQGKVNSKESAEAWIDSVMMTLQPEQFKE
jgi:hypothetical protein